MSASKFSEAYLASFLVQDGNIAAEERNTEPKPVAVAYKHSAASLFAFFFGNFLQEVLQRDFENLFLSVR